MVVLRIRPDRFTIPAAAMQSIILKISARYCSKSPIVPRRLTKPYLGPTFGLWVRWGLLLSGVAGCGQGNLSQPIEIRSSSQGCHRRSHVYVTGERPSILDSCGMGLPALWSARSTWLGFPLIIIASVHSFRCCIGGWLIRSGWKFEFLAARQGIFTDCATTHTWELLP